MKLTYIIALLLLFNVPSYAAGDAQAGQKKSGQCAACHGADGNTNTPSWPKLAGQHPEYLAKQLHDFRDGKRQNPQMSPMASHLSDADIADLAAYFSTQTRAPDTAKPKDLASGEHLYRAGDANRGLAACMACHGPTGDGNPAALYPKISGQHAGYMAVQLKQFKAEALANDRNGVMRDIASRMSNADIEAVSNYIQGLH
ncbi:MAG: c-type cytochrome [Gammaproteobacteria bacterium]